MTTINIKCEGKNVQFSSFNVNDISSLSSVLIIGKDCHTRRTLITNILNNQFIQNSLIISPAEKHTHFYKDKYPSAKIEHEYSSHLITSFINEKCKGAIVFDECKITGNQWSSDPAFKDLIYNARHYNKLLIFVIPFPLNIPPEFRCNFDYIFLLSNDFYSNQKKLYDHYAGMFPTFNSFRQVFLQLTENDGAMTICNRGAKKDLLDKIFWYNADHTIDKKMENNQEKYIDESSIVIHITL